MLRKLLIISILTVLSGSAFAVPIVGTIGFAQNFGASWAPTGGTVANPVGTATGIDFTNDSNGYTANVNAATGDFLAAGGQNANFFDFVFNPATPGTLLWSVTDSNGIVWSLFMQTINIVSQTVDQIGLDGTAYITASGGGYTQTLGHWNLTLDTASIGGQASFSFSSTAATIAVPEPNSLAILGLGLILLLGITKPKSQDFA